MKFSGIKKYLQNTVLFYSYHTDRIQETGIKRYVMTVCLPLSI